MMLKLSFGIHEGITVVVIAENKSKIICVSEIQYM